MREKPRDSARLKHMLHAIDNIQRFINDKDVDEFEVDSLLYYGVVKNLEIIGEAAYMLTKEFQDQHSLTPWKKIIGMRHFLVHGYYQVDAGEVWLTVNRDIMPLKSQLSQYLEDIEN